MKHTNKLNKSKQGYGVGEWALYSYNIGTGCINNCKYCYARDIAVDIASKANRPYSLADWPTESINTRKADIHQHVEGTIMFPSMHDISETYLSTYKLTLKNFLHAGNQVLIVTKPRIAVIREICDEFTEHKDNVLFRFTITCLDNTLSAFWEPGAPLPEERIQALHHAHAQGFKTSVSVEPMIDSVEDTIMLYNTLEPYITEDIWFGKMNFIKQRVSISSIEARYAVDAILKNQSDKNIRMLYRQLEGKPKAMWKDSVWQQQKI